MSADDTYAPKSPDFSAIFSAPGPTAAPPDQQLESYNHQQQQAHPAAAPPQPPQPPQNQQHHFQQPQIHQFHQQSFPGASSQYPPQPQTQSPHTSHGFPSNNPAYGYVPQPYGSRPSSSSSASYLHAPPPVKSEYHNYGSLPANQYPPYTGYHQEQQLHQHHYQQEQQQQPHAFQQHQPQPSLQQPSPHGQQPQVPGGGGNWLPSSYGQDRPSHVQPSSFQDAPPLSATELKSEYPTEPDMPPRRAAAAAPVVEPSPVRTKFPTARIKRIMQADEEVGKVAQQTPIAVGKALEMFMIHLVTKSAEVAKEKGSKRVTAPMLKHVVETDEQWDFLREIVGKVEHEKEGSKGKAKVESDTDEEETPEPKKKGRGGRRKKV